MTARHGAVRRRAGLRRRRQARPGCAGAALLEWYPREVEEVLLSDVAVTEVAVVGRPAHEWGERVVAFGVAGAGVTPTPKTLDRLCLVNIARFKRPKQYVFVPELPKNHYGKVFETELRARLSAT